MVLFARIRDIVDELLSPSGDEYVEVDSVANGSQKLKLSSMPSVVGGVNSSKAENQSTDFTFVLGSNIRIESLDVRIASGTPTFKAGTSLGSDDLCREFLVDASDSNYTIGKTFSASTTIYCTISGGNVTARVNYRKDYL